MRGGIGGGHSGNKGSAPEEGGQEVVSLSLQKLRELADSLRASMPADDTGEDKVGSPSLNKSKSHRSKSFQIFVVSNR